MSPSESLKKGNTILTDHSHCYRILGQEWQNTVIKISYPSPGSHPWPGSGAACSWGSFNDGPTPTCSGGISASVPAGCTGCRVRASCRGLWSCAASAREPGQSGCGHQGPDSGVPPRGGSPPALGIAPQVPGCPSK